MPHPSADAPSHLPYPRGVQPTWASWGKAPEGRGWRYTDEHGDEIELPTCPVLKRPPWWGRLVTEWRAYQGGHLLEPGGIGDQPAWWLEMMHAVTNWWEEFSEAAAKRRAGR